jgi:hypothetical protein
MIEICLKTRRSIERSWISMQKGEAGAIGMDYLGTSSLNLKGTCSSNGFNATLAAGVIYKKAVRDAGQARRVV